MRRNRSPLTNFLTGLCGMLTLALLVMACGGDTSNAPSAQQLIKDSQAAIQKVSSYHFNLKTDNLGATSSLPVQSADGDLVSPDKLQANATVLFSGSTLQTQLIAIGDDEYVNLLGAWTKTTEILDPRKITDPETGIAGILGHIQNPGTPSDSNSGGTSCWSVSGKLDAQYLAAFTGGGAPSGTMDDITVCIGKTDKLPYLIVIKGIAATGDTAQTTRTFKFSKFNEQITINPPPISNTPTS